jgi:hypothetical protein
MTSAPTNATADSNPATGQARQTKQIILNEIRAKWGKFSEDDLSSLKNKDDLVTQRATKYGLGLSVAQRDVDALMKGRQI